MPRISGITRQILAQNDGRDPERLTLKLGLMRQDPFAFFRGANSLFLSYLPRRHAIFRAPSTLVCGDLHFENFGAFKGDNRLCYFDVNDFDEACVAPFTVDIVRFLACVLVAAGGLSAGRAQTRRLAQAFIGAYVACIRDGKPRWIERSLAEGVFRQLLRRAIRRTRTELLNRFSKDKNGRRRLRIDGRRTLALRDGELGPLRRFLRDYARLRPDPGFFDLIAAARRIAGNGSLGLERYLLLVRGRGSPNQNFALDLKYAAPSAVAAWLASPQPAWPSEAVRVVAIQRIMQAIPPALLHAAQFENRPFVLKELQPSIDRLELDAWRGKPNRILEAVAGMGRVAAWAHLRGCGHYDAASIESLQAYVDGAPWIRGAERIAAAAAARMIGAWRTYCEDYDGALAPARGAKSMVT